MRALYLVTILTASCLAGGVARADERVYASPEAVRPLAIGSTVPSVTVQSVEGTAIDLASLVRDDGALLVFYRGGW